MSENLRSSTNVAFYGYKPRKYWNIKKCKITVRERPTLENSGLANFLNELRFFLYEIDERISRIIDQILIEDSDYLLKKNITASFWDARAFFKELDLEKNITLEIREYEKEFFYLKCLSLKKKPQLVLRAILRLSMEVQREEIFTSPELLFQLLNIQNFKPVYRKEVTFLA